MKKDSLCAKLIHKVNNDNIYVPIIRYILNELNPENTHFRDTLFSNYFAGEYFFKQTLKYLKKIKINNYTLVIVDFAYSKSLDYFIVNQNNEVTDRASFSSYREAVSSRKVYDWNHDGKDELVEVRKYCGQMFTADTDVVYSLVNDSIKLIFSITTREVNCVTTDDHDIGKFLLRKYTPKGNGIYLISETEGWNDCNKDFKPVKTLTWKEYEMSVPELLKEFGEKYDR